MARTFPLRTLNQRIRARMAIDEAPEDWVCKLAQESRNDRQNRALWGWIKVLREALPDTLGQFSPEDVKARFMHALGAELRFLPELEGAGMFPVGFRSSALTKEQFAGLLTLIDEYAARHGVDLPRNPEFYELTDNPKGARAA